MSVSVPFLIAIDRCNHLNEFISTASVRLLNKELIQCYLLVTVSKIGQSKSVTNTCCHRSHHSPRLGLCGTDIHTLKYFNTWEEPLHPMVLVIGSAGTWDWLKEPQQQFPGWTFHMR